MTDDTTPTELEVPHPQPAVLPDPRCRHHDDIPIEQLPDEVLEYIFIYLRDLCTPDNTATRYTDPEWVRVTWVCRRFRTICLAYPLLWSRIMDYNDRWFLAFVDRSAPSPLDVDISLRFQNSESMEHLLQSVPRMRTLKLNGVVQRMCEVILPRLNTPAPQLVMFSIQMWPFGNVVYADVQDLVYNAFARQAPRVRSLKFGTFIRLTPTFFMLSPALESLDINGAYSLKEVVEILRMTPGLRSFAAIAGIEPKTTDAMTATVPVELPYMKSITLEMGHSSVAHLLRSLKMPAIFLISITLLSYDFTTESNTATLSPLSGLLRQSHEVAPFQSLQLYSDSKYWGHMDERVLMWHTPYAGTKYVNFDSPRPQVEIKFRPRPYNPVIPTHTILPFYKHLCACIPPADVGTLTLEMDYVLAPREWIEILRPFARVKHLKLVGGRLSTVLDALATTISFFPVLSRVAISASFRGNATPPPLLRELTDVARARSTGEARLHIAFEDCDRINPAPYEELYEFANVTWDNMSFFEDSMEDDPEEKPWLTLIS